MTNENAINILRHLSPPRTSKAAFDAFKQAIEMAIEALKEPQIIRCKDCKYWNNGSCEYLSHNKNKGDEEWKLAVENDIRTIWKLPSAEPKIIRCKDCKHHWTHKCMDSMPIEICDLEQTFYDAEHDFCSLAERKIK